MSADRVDALYDGQELSGWVADWVERMTLIYHQFEDAGSVRCFLGHRAGNDPSLTLLMQASNGEGYGEHVVLGGDPGSTMGYPSVRDGVEGLSLLALLLNQIDHSVVLEHGPAVGRSYGHPVFEQPYHAFDDRVLPWELHKLPPPLGIRLATWVERHAAAIRRLGSIETILCRLDAGHENEQEIYSCKFSVENGRDHAVELRVTGNRSLKTADTQARSTSEALAMLSYILREVRLPATLVSRAIA
ncbi:hypothetical protein NF699_02185 [Sphingomonadaceae bacterium OTU29LAMAA1]|nr:hypothetical protein NF699_02185 [Sphingomonadaceae bacterium OTU29LAMAA1]